MHLRSSGLHSISRGDVIALSVVALVCVASFWNAIGDPLRSIQEDISFQMQGLHAAANEQIAEGRFPHWNPYGLAGQRLFADVQLALLYPGSVLFRVLPFGLACLLTLMAHYTAAAVTTYAFARMVLRVSPPAAGVAGVVFALGGFSLGHCNHLGFVYALPYLPLSLLALHGFGQSEERPAMWWWLTGVVSLCAMILSGGVAVLQLTLVALAWMAGVGAMHAVAAERYKSATRMLVGLATMGVVAAGLTAMQSVPTLQLYAESARAAWSDSELAGGTIDWRTLVFQLVAPGVLGDADHGSWVGLNHERLVFVGGGALVLAVVSLALVRRGRWVVPLLVLLVVSLLLAMGDPLLSRAVGFVQGPIHLRQPSRFVGLFQFALACLAAVGFDSWVRQAKERSVWLEAVGLVTCLSM